MASSSSYELVFHDAFYAINACGHKIARTIEAFSASPRLGDVCPNPHPHSTPALAMFTPTPRATLTRTWCVAALALICCALWGSAIPCIKIGYELLGIQNGDVPSEFLFAGVRFMLAGAIALAAAVITRRRLPRVSRTGWPLVIRLSLAKLSCSTPSFISAFQTLRVCAAQSSTL